MEWDPTNRTAAGSYLWQIRVRSEAHLDDWLKDYFAGLQIRCETDGTSTLTGELTDISAVYGLILKLRDSGIIFVSLQVERVSLGGGGKNQWAY